VEGGNEKKGGGESDQRMDGCRCSINLCFDLGLQHLEWRDEEEKKDEKQIHPRVHLCCILIWWRCDEIHLPHFHADIIREEFNHHFRHHNMRIYDPDDLIRLLSSDVRNTVSESHLNWECYLNSRLWALHIHIMAS